MSTTNIIFHLPILLDPNAKTASGIRPRKMLQAFKDLGYHVDEISGNGKERKKKIKEIICKIRKGVKYAFLYSESSTMPTALTDNHHLPLRPLMDYMLFRACKKSSIPIGLFYRDIYWLFPDYKKTISFWKYIFARFFFRLDLIAYEKYISRVYLPSTRMKSFIPIISEVKFDELPPAHNNKVTTQSNLEICHPSEKIKLFYLGGIGTHYQMHALWQAVSDLQFITLTICTRELEWLKIKHEYEAISDGIPDNINVIHKAGNDLKPHFQQADICLVFVKPKPYWSFAVPVKLYEYIGEGKPIIATNGTMAGEIVDTNDLGWSMPYDYKSMLELLSDLNQNKQSIIQKAKKVIEFAKHQTWEERARKVANDLMGESPTQI